MHNPAPGVLTKRGAQTGSKPSQSLKKTFTHHKSFQMILKILECRTKFSLTSNQPQ